MEAKLFEAVDYGVHVPMIAIRCTPANEGEIRLLACAGYGSEAEDQGGYVVFAALPKYLGESQIQAAVGMQVVRDWLYLKDNWERLEPGTVLDVAFLAGERIAPGESMFGDPKDCQ